MKKIGMTLGVLLLALVFLFTVGCPEKPNTPEKSGKEDTDPNKKRPNEPGPKEPEPKEPEPNYSLEPDALIHAIFVQDTDGTDDGMERLVSSMKKYGLKFYQTSKVPDGLIASDDVVLLKINSQWPQRGGTNTDLVRSVIQAVVDHPDGFFGEVIVADNGQAQYSSGPYGGGSLEWTSANATDRQQSVMKVVNDFKTEGYNVSGVLWDKYTKSAAVREFSTGNTADGFVEAGTPYNTGWRVSYAKFTTEYGTCVSFKEGIWDADTSTYNSEKLKVINMPVLKYHDAFKVTGALKSYFGTCSFTRSGGENTHGTVGNGGMAAQMLGTRMPALNILDMIWVGV
jgi:uncharacterized protein (DUF362 family)